VFEVIDTGIGIAEDKLPELFQPFVQADASVTRAYGGTGLGLALTRRFAQLLGGDVTATSEVGVGSTFRLEVSADLGACASAPSIAPLAAARGGEAPLALIVEDDAASRELTMRTLSVLGVRALGASTATEGLELMRERRPDVVLLDIALPDFSGWELLERRQAVAELAEIPVLVVSCDDDRGRSFAMGASEHFEKPVDQRALAAAVLRYARREAAQPQAEARRRVSG